MKEKLVRDKIPEIIGKATGKKPKLRKATEKEYFESLKQKLKEEMEEFLHDNNPEELADIMEIIYALAEHKKITKQQLEEMRKQKAKKRGGFKKRLILEF